jgi:hypothetical protein
MATFNHAPKLHLTTTDIMKLRNCPYKTAWREAVLLRDTFGFLHLRGLTIFHYADFYGIDPNQVLAGLGRRPLPPVAV